MYHGVSNEPPTKNLMQYRSSRLIRSISSLRCE